MRPNDVAQALDLDRIAKDHVWKVEPSCATSGEGKTAHATKQGKPHMLTRFQQASSKVSPGSARTSRSRKSKRGSLPTANFIQPFQRTQHHIEKQQQRHCTTTVTGRSILLKILPMSTPPTSHDRLRPHWICIPSKFRAGAIRHEEPRD